MKCLYPVHGTTSVWKQVTRTFGIASKVAMFQADFSCQHSGLGPTELFTSAYLTPFPLQDLNLSPLVEE